MNFTLISPETKAEAEISLPCSEEEVCELCAKLQVKNTASTEVVVAKMGKYPDLFLLLGRKTHKLEELNFLMKALSTLKSAEKELFFMATGANSNEDLPYLINLTYNLDCFSVISDFSYLHLMGRALHLSQSEESEDNFDNTAFFLQSIQDGKFKITEKGVVFYDKTQWKDQYVNGNFPYLPQKNAPLALKIAKDSRCEFLSLPTKETALFKVFERVDVKDLKDCTMELVGLEKYSGMKSIAKGEFTFPNCNKLAQSLSKLREDEREQVERLVEFTKVETVSQLLVLISCLDHFSVMTDVKTAEEYGKYLVIRQNRLKFDEKLSSYLDYEGYGKEMATEERGVFTNSGYLKYEGYNKEMEEILGKNIGYKARNYQNSGEMKLFMPITQKTAEGQDFPPSRDAIPFLLPEIQKFLSDYQEKMGEPRGFMGQYPSRDTIHAKVEKYSFDAEIQENTLFAVAILDLNDQLTKEELQRMKQVIGGQAAGNLNEMLGQQGFDVSGEKLHLSLWNSSHWYLKTEEELKEMG
ncbi:MAG: antirestriction protein ArdA [Eubacteriales bacterium]